MKALTRRKSEKKWNYFFKKSFQKKSINSFAYYVKIGILHSILKDLREIFNISRIKKYFHFFFTFSLVKAFIVYLPILIKINTECVLFSETVEVCISKPSMILYYFDCCYWFQRKMVTVAKGNFKFPLIFLLDPRPEDGESYKFMSVRPSVRLSVR